MKILLSPARHMCRRAFSLVEMLVAVAVFGLVMLLVFQMLDRTQVTWKGARDSVSEYKSARVAFEAITRRLSQATLNTYWKIQKGGTSGQLSAMPFERNSDLHYVSGPASQVIGTGAGPTGAGPRVGHCVFFQAPTGQSQSQVNQKYRYANFQNTLNSWGYFVEFNNDQADRPAFLNGLSNAPAPRARFRLMEYSTPAEANQIYKVSHDINLQLANNSNAKVPMEASYEWFTNREASGINFPGNYPGAAAGNSLESRNVRVVAENILSFFVLPTKSVDPDKSDDLAPNYLYDSRAWLTGSVSGKELLRTTRNQLAPTIQVTMIALDESDFKRMTNQLNITNGQDLAKVPFYADVAKLFTNANRFDEDLVELNRLLTRPQGAVKLQVQYRVFRATVRVRESRWGGFDPSLAQ